MDWRLHFFLSDREAKSTGGLDLSSESGRERERDGDTVAVVAGTAVEAMIACGGTVIDVSISDDMSTSDNDLLWKDRPTSAQIDALFIGMEKYVGR